MNTNLSAKQIMAVGLMLFALFFGAGNMIFPPFLGQDAGTHVWTAIIGFLITGVGLPLLAIIAIARVGDVQTMASRVHPVYGVIFTVVMYLVIGPLFAIPRTGTVSYEIGVIPFLSENAVNSPLPLAIFSVVFFAITAWLAMNPTKLVDTIGKILTPALLIILAVIVIKALITPLGDPQAPTGPYVDGPFFKGFVEGYLTMDTIAALVFGIIVISSIQGLGVSNKKSITKICVQAGLIAAAGLALVYISLAYIGSTAPDAIGIQENGGALLSKAADHLFGSFGSIILALAIVFACLTTSIGLVSACATYFNKLMPRFSYKTIVLIFSIFSMIIANIGLTQLIAFSVPVLVIIYPLAIVLIVLSFFHNFFKGSSLVYIVALIPTGIISLIDGLKTAGLNVTALTDALSFLPLFDQGIGWIVPAIAGALVGYVIALATGESKKTVQSN
ncbi:branched-chain amino acid transport system II carrier protein [Cytobacillus solani]|uniref:Branched-chain amino acid transport system carrier protein n=1 Tax=Cytobacillus solani TaxID=1637975 RepID=A0A0Q3QSY0_9BACI|nr:branched-chain amino acid transport system II carrier protein [Cytobacillus solani]KOP83745.1 branched-chain amino acid transporter [Bacillus sp. FJAT-21945]KQL20822.1 branched-chain amino acid transporter [Cytobacillus solani]USK54062.1 branched-chain amino acid transport system II carrier protein [Cytobacillus solani]